MNEALIAAVAPREPLWKPNDNLHRNVYVLKKLWEEVAAEVQEDVKTIKARWKNLRAYFYKEQRKIEQSKDRKLCYYSTWQYYDQLMFLSEHCASEKDSALSLGDDDNVTDTMMYEIPFEEQNEALTESDDSSHAPPKKKKRNATEKDQLMEIEKKRLEILEKACVREKSDDLLFFESLLPYMSGIPVVRKLRLRSKIQELILNEIEEVEVKQEGPDTP